MEDEFDEFLRRSVVEVEVRDRLARMETDRLYRWQRWWAIYVVEKVRSLLDWVMASYVEDPMVGFIQNRSKDCVCPVCEGSGAL